MHSALAAAHLYRLGGDKEEPVNSLGTFSYSYPLPLSI